MIFLMQGCTKRGDFKQLLEKARPKQGETLLLGFPEEKD